MNPIKLLEKFLRAGIITIVVLTMTLGGLFLNLRAAGATESSDAPSFPSCLNQTGNGDKAHWDSGLHQIVGNGLLEGQDDVYSLSNGNYLQCFQPPDKKVCIQTNWWRTDQELAGWFSVNGSQWNLGDVHYLAMNINYDCVPKPTPSPSPSPTPIPTPSPSASPSPTPTPTPTPTVTPTVTQEQRQEQTQNNNQTVNVTVGGAIAGVKAPAEAPETGVSVLGLTSMFGAGPVGYALSRFGKGRVSAKKEEENLSETALGLVKGRGKN